MSTAPCNAAHSWILFFLGGHVDAGRQTFGLENKGNALKVYRFSHVVTVFNSTREEEIILSFGYEDFQILCLKPRVLVTYNASKSSSLSLLSISIFVPMARPYHW